MTLPNDIARCRGVAKRGVPVLVCSSCQRRLAWEADHRREVGRMFVVEPPKRVIDCTEFLPVPLRGGGLE